LTRQCPSGTGPYIIRAGDTYFSLAARFNTSVSAILAANPGVDPDNLRVGQVICIPGVTPPTQCPTGTFPYVIRSGDTFFSIARRFNVSVDALIQANPGVDPDALRVGQVICVPGAAPPQCPPGSTTYTIRAGDTLFSIAQRFNTTVDRLLQLNPGIDPNNLQVGQVICVPGAAPPQCPPGSTTYVIRAGDTLFSIAQRFNTTVDRLLQLNPGIDPNNLRVGQIICVPTTAPPTCPPGSTTYTIRAGDTLFSIAQRFNTTVDRLLQLNPGIDPNNLQVGQVICVPTTVPPPGQCPAGSTTYTIRAGDTLFGIAQRFNTTVARLLELNPGIDPNNLQVGQVICVPTTAPPPGQCPAGSTTYTIRAGDTLFGIAQRLNTTVARLLELNPGIDPNNLRVGQVICVPV